MYCPVERRLAIVLKIRSKLTLFFSRYSGGTEIKEILPECFRDFNLIDEEAIYVTTLKIANQRAKEKIS